MTNLTSSSLAYSSWTLLIDGRSLRYGFRDAEALVLLHEAPFCGVERPFKRLECVDVLPGRRSKRIQPHGAY